MTLEELAGRTGWDVGVLRECIELGLLDGEDFDVGLVERVWDAAGLGGPHELLSESDAAAARAVSVASSAGFPEEALLQLVRVYADALNRVGEAEGRLFHFYVHEGLRASGLEGDALVTATAEVSDQLLGLVEPAVLFFHRKGLSRAIRDDLVLHVAEDAGLLPPNDETGQLRAAVSFIDLARFTALTDVMGDAAAVEILNRFSDLVRGCVVSCDGRVAKQIGDAFMLVFNDADSAIECAPDVADERSRRSSSSVHGRGCTGGPSCTGKVTTTARR